MPASRPSILDFLNEVQEWQKETSQAEQVREIVPVPVWLNSSYYVGESGKSLYPFWKKQIVDIFETNRGKYNELIITGGIGIGKSTFGLYCLIRRLYELSCYKRVQRLFDMMPTAILAMVYFSLSQKLAKRSGFAQLSNLIDEIPYFQEHFPRSQKIESQLEFPENLLIYSGSSASAVTGMNLIGSLLDEANFFGTAGLGEVQGHEVDYSKVSAMYTAIVNRGQSRFKKAGRDDSLSILISSTTTHSSLTESRIAKALKEGKDSHTKVVVGTLWEVKPKGTYSSEKFWVFTGNDFLEPQVVHSVGDIETCSMTQFPSEVIDSVKTLPEGEAFKVLIDRLPQGQKSRFYQVPVDFKSAFEKDVVYSIRDILGLSIANMGKLFGSEDIYRESVKMMENWEKPFLSDEFTLSILDDSSIKDYINPKFVPENKTVPRYFHYDQSYSSDRTGIAWTYVHHYIEEKVQYLDEDGEKRWRIERKPVFCVEGMVAILPPKPPKKISIRKCRDVIYHLRDDLGLQIGGGTFDQFASAESRQEFQENGVDATYLSVDKTDEQYLLFVTLLNEGRIMWAYNEIAHKELFNLDHNRVRRKVDHPKGSDSSKDLMDAVVGSVWNAHQASIQSVGIADAKASLGGIDSDDGEDLFPELSRVVRTGTRTRLFDY